MAAPLPSALSLPTMAAFLPSALSLPTMVASLPSALSFSTSLGPQLEKRTIQSNPQTRNLENFTKLYLKSNPCVCKLNRISEEASPPDVIPDFSRRDLISSAVGAAAFHGISGASSFQNSQIARGEEFGRFFAASSDLDKINSVVPPGREIAPGLIPSSIIKGCWQLSGGHRGDRISDRTYGKAAVEDFKTFFAAGIKTFDTADIYGPSESIIGDFLRTSKINDVQVFTKHCVFSTNEMQNPSLDYVRRRIKQSLRNLGVSSLDLVQFYWDNYSIPNYVQTALYLAELQSEGLIRHIGVTNFDTAKVAEMLDSGVPILSSQVQYSLLDRRPENFHIDFCRKNGISILPFGVLAGSFLTNKYLGMTYEEAQQRIVIDTYSKSKYLSVLKKVGGWDYLQDLLQALNSISMKHNVSLSNVAIQWTYNRPQVAAVIIGARNAFHVDDLRQCFSFSLDDDDYHVINNVLDRYPSPQGDIYTWERGGVF